MGGSGLLKKRYKVTPLESSQRGFSSASLPCWDSAGAPLPSLFGIFKCYFWRSFGDLLRKNYSSFVPNKGFYFWFYK